MSLPLSYLNIPSSKEDEPVQIQAIRISCLGEVRDLSTPKFQTFSISAHDPVFSVRPLQPDIRTTSDEEIDLAPLRPERGLPPSPTFAPNVSPLSRLVGIPLVARKCEDTGHLWNLDLTNIDAANLFRNLEPTTRAPPSGEQSFILEADAPSVPFGDAAIEWLDPPPGPVLIARLDRKPLHPLHAAAICSFATTHLDPAFRDCRDEENAALRSPARLTRSSRSSSIARIRTPSAEFRSDEGRAEAVGGGQASGPSQRIMSPELWDSIVELRRRTLAQITSGTFAAYFEVYKAKRVIGRPDLMAREGEEDADWRVVVERRSVPLEEVTPREDWMLVESPYDV